LFFIAVSFPLGDSKAAGHRKRSMLRCTPTAYRHEGTAKHGGVHSGLSTTAVAASLIRSVSRRLYGHSRL